MSVKISISLDEELVSMIKKEAKRTGRTVSDIFKDAVKAYQKERISLAYENFMKAKKSRRELVKELEQFETAQLEDIEWIK